MAPSAEKLHLTEHEKNSKAPPWLRAALRKEFGLGNPYDFKFGGLVLGDEFHMTVDEYEEMVAAVRGHGACEPCLKPLAIQGPAALVRNKGEE